MYPQYTVRFVEQPAIRSDCGVSEEPLTDRFLRRRQLPVMGYGNDSSEIGPSRRHLHKLGKFLEAAEMLTNRVPSNRALPNPTIKDLPHSERA